MKKTHYFKDNRATKLNMDLEGPYLFSALWFDDQNEVIQEIWAQKFNSSHGNYNERNSTSFLKL